MFHVLGERERDRFITALGEIVPADGHYYVLGDARQDNRATYGITPAELDWRFSETDE